MLSRPLRSPEERSGAGTRRYWGYAARARWTTDSAASFAWGAVCSLSSLSLASMEGKTGKANRWGEGDFPVWMSQRKTP